MNSSSQPAASSTTSSDTYTIDVSSLPSFNFTSDTISLNNYNPCVTSYNPSYTLTTTQISSLTTSQLNTITIGNTGSIDTSTIQWNMPKEWIDTFPDFKRIEEMCEEYPGLKIAYDKFKTVYKLVTSDYDTPKDKRSKP